MKNVNIDNNNTIGAILLQSKSFFIIRMSELHQLSSLQSHSSPIWSLESTKNGCSYNHMDKKRL